MQAIITMGYGGGSVGPRSLILSPFGLYVVRTYTTHCL